MSLFKFNAEELKELAIGLAPVLIPMLQPKAPIAAPPELMEEELDSGVTIQDGKLIYLDPVVQTADETTKRAMKALPVGTATYVGRNSTQIVNHSEETMNTCGNWKKNRANWRTRQNIR